MINTEKFNSIVEAAKAKTNDPKWLRTVELRLEKAEVDGKPAVILTLLEVNFCSECQTFHSTKEAHTCIR
jgi:hypothetical protein